MKKYKEWLTNEIEIMESETSENYPHEQMVEREVVLNLINQLDELEALSQKWIDNNKEPFHHFETKKVDYYVSTDFLQNLIIPKQELPVIPKYVAKYLEFAKKEASLIQVMVTVSEGWPTMKKEFDWISENDETFARAWLDGYEVEEQKYIIEVSDGLYLSQPLGDTSNNEIVMTWSKEQAYKFKDEESIEGHLLKFKGSMAKPVEELEE